MRRFAVVFSILILFSLGCRLLVPQAETPFATPTPAALVETPAETVPPSAETLPEATEAEGGAAAARPADVDDPFQLHVHPDGPLYPGDQVSLEVVPPEAFRGRDVTVEVWLDSGLQLVSLGKAGIHPYGIGGRRQATFLWAWDTRGLLPGEYDLHFGITPEGPVWTETLTLAKPLPGLDDGRWGQTESDCCVLYYITGTEAERDLAYLQEMADAQADYAAAQLGYQPEGAVTITFLPRVLGHGGFAGEEIAVSYLDGSYAAGSPEMVLRHELVHWFDLHRSEDWRPTMLVEGLAVYLSGGHFKPEPLMPRAAALLEPSADCGLNGEVCSLGGYTPLDDLAADFYDQQHESAYLQAGALVEFMVANWGWEAFDRFYLDIPRPDEDTTPEAIDSALQAHFGLSLAELEQRFKQTLAQQDLQPWMAADVGLTIRYYDSVRRYQQLLDPSAYFKTAWLPDAAAMRERGIVADFVRRPQAAENRAVESLLAEAGQSLEQGDISRGERLLDGVDAALETWEEQVAQ